MSFSYESLYWMPVSLMVRSPLLWGLAPELVGEVPNCLPTLGLRLWEVTRDEADFTTLECFVVIGRDS